MAHIFQTTDTSTALTLPNGDQLTIVDGVNVTVPTTYAVTIDAGASALTRLINDGNLYGAIRMNADTARIVNYGLISSVNDAFDVNATGGGTNGRLEILNYGTVVSGFNMIDVQFAETPLDLTLINYGGMSTQGGFPFLTGGPLLSVSILNTGTIRGGIFDADASGIIRLANYGTMNVGSLSLESGFFATLLNHGTIASGFGGPVTVTFGTRDDIVVNHGAIQGTILLGDGADRYEGLGNGVVTFSNSGGAVQGGAGNDTLAGGDLQDLFLGGTGADLLVGRGGNDTLRGDDEDDRLLGGDGDDSLEGGAGNDTLAGGSGADTALGGADNDLIVGQDGDDDLQGGTGNDTLDGGAGNDSLAGGADDDQLRGQDGNDSLAGEAGNDLIVGQGGDDVLEGGADLDTLDGGAGNDVLLGGQGVDVLRGREGDDDLAGGEDLDFLTGGPGADTFLFRSATEAGLGGKRDQILDFEQGVDIINVAAMSPGVFAFIGTAAFSGPNQVRVIETPSGSTIVQFNLDAVLDADAEIRVANVTGLTAEDFAL